MPQFRVLRRDGKLTDPIYRDTCIVLISASDKVLPRFTPHEEIKYLGEEKAVDRGQRKVQQPACQAQI